MEKKSRGKKKQIWCALFTSESKTSAERGLSVKENKKALPEKDPAGGGFCQRKEGQAERTNRAAVAQGLNPDGKAAEVFIGV